MRTFSILAISGLLLLTFSACKNNYYTPINVKNVKEMPVGHSQQGFYYNLPHTVVAVDIIVVKKQQIPGPFRDYASKYLGLEDVIRENSVQYQIESADITTYAQPDPDQFYFVQYDKEYSGNLPFSMQFNNAGIITGVNTQQDVNLDTPKEIQLQTENQFGSEITFNHFLDKNLQEKVDTIIERIQRDTLTIERKKLRRTWVEKSSEVRAKEIAEYIIDVRRKKYDLIYGFAEITYSKETIQYMVEQLEKEEEDYLELFTGVTLYEEMKVKRSYLPTLNNIGKPVDLFHFSNSTGVHENSVPLSSPVTLVAEADSATRQMNLFTFQPPSGDDETMNRGFFYRIPEHAHLSILKDETPIAEARVLVNQLGTITSLPPENYEIEFYPSTGSVKSVKKISTTEQD
ncbi:MAG: DUF4831 family protein [Bacteroidota bacterium]